MVPGPEGRRDSQESRGRQGRAGRRRLTAAAAALAVLALTAVAAAAARPLLAVGAAYKAKTLCSEIFVARRAPADVLRTLHIDDLRPLRLLRARIDTSARTVSAGVPGVLRRTARFEGGVGCALVRSRTGLFSQPTKPAADEPHPTPATVSSTTSPAPDALFDARASLPATTSHALDAVVDAAFAETAGARPKRTRAVVVLRHGEIVAERYAPGIDATTPLPGWSLTKSVLNALVGVAVRDGVLALDEPAALHAWRAPGDARARITVSELLRMRSGLEFDEDQAQPTSHIFRMLYDEPDMAAFAAARPLAAPPGSRWSYSSGTSLILSRLLRERLGDDAYRGFLRRALFAPLGMTRATLEADAAGTFVASSYMYATAREWARFGQLYLQDGVWRGERVLPEGWVSYTTSPAPADSGAAYGAHFWLATPAEYRGPVVPLPRGIFHAAGHEAQFITIVPSHGVVIVRLGRTRYPGAWAHDRFVAAVLAALQP